MSPLVRSETPSAGSNQAQTSLLIEGWRGINHSYSLLNQQQILELLKVEGLRIFHHDLPFFNKAWNRIDNDSGFLPEQQEIIDALPSAEGSYVDCVYRICSPILAGAEDDRRRTLTFMITEMGLTEDVLAVEPERYPFFTRDDNLIVTSSRWSRDRIADFGFPAEKICILPLGVDTTIFYPFAAEQRAAMRAGIGIHPEEVLFVNVGGALWNKGGDLLLRAFAALRARGCPARLIVKDQRGLYGVAFEAVVAKVIQDCPALRDPGTLAAISVISGNLFPRQLSELYAIADCYVSPYRAEGFNLPALESIACGSPVIVTAGGATDDFCSEGVAVRIPGKAGTVEIGPPRAGRYIEPDLDALIEAMSAVAVGRRLDPEQSGRKQVLEAFSWRRAAHGLAALARGQTWGDVVHVEPQARDAWVPEVAH